MTAASYAFVAATWREAAEQVHEQARGAMEGEAVAAASSGGSGSGQRTPGARKAMAAAAAVVRLSDRLFARGKHAGGSSGSGGVPAARRARLKLRGDFQSVGSLARHAGDLLRAADDLEKMLHDRLACDPHDSYGKAFCRG